MRTESGTWYMSALVEIFNEYHTREDVLSMMLKVNQKVNLRYKEQSTGSNEFKQCLSVTIRKKIYF